jgi:hypothetical protein
VIFAGLGGKPSAPNHSPMAVDKKLLPLIFQIPLGGVAIRHQASEPVDRLATALEGGGIGGEFLVGGGELSARAAQRRALGLAGAERRRDRSQVRQFIQIALGGLARAIDGCEAGTRVNRDINRPSR